MLAALQRTLRQKIDRWLFQLRDAEPGEVFLNRRRVFILPTGAGLVFAVLGALLLIGSINYNLSLGFALTFLLAACGIIDMVQTVRNLAALHLAPGQALPVFAGEEASFELQVINRSGRDRFALWIDFQSAGAARHVIDVAAGARTFVHAGAPSAARGWMRAPRVQMATSFPLGLFRSWCYWQPDLKVLVYPYPEARAPALPMSDAGAQDGPGRSGSDDFAGVRSYQAGDALRSLAWRQIARLPLELGGQLVSKHFEGGAMEQLVLDFDALPTRLDVELRLSRMARWVLEAEQRALPYAFRIGALGFDAAVGAAHQAACLRALALYGQAEPA
ncbi:MAG: DUF58 domain-containing protein [Pseudomonadota bacterium]